MIYLLSILTIFGLSLPFMNYYLGWLGMVSFLPFIFLLDFMNSKKYSNKKQFLNIWLIGVISFYIILGWSLQTDPQRWAFVTGWQIITGQWLIYTVFVLLFSIQYLMFASLYLKIKPKLLDWKSFIIIPSIWVVSEAGRSLFFSLTMYGKGSTTGLHWNFGVLGVATSVTPLVYLSRLIGMFGLSFVTVMIGICIYWVYKKIYKLPIIILVSIVFISLLSWLIWLIPRSSKSIQVGYVQLSQSFDNYIDGDSYFDQLSNIVAGVNVKNDLLVLPEYSNFFTDSKKSNLAHDISKKLVKSDGSIVTSYDDTDGKQTHKNRLVIYDNNGKVMSSEDKTFLIPIGEYLPDLVVGLYKLGGMQQALQMHEESRIVSKGLDRSKPTEIYGFKIAPLACSGAITPELYRGLVNNGAEIITNSASLGAFTNAPLYHAQSRQFAHFMAVSNNRPFVQSAGGAYSFVLDNNGVFISGTHDLETNYDSVNINIIKARTPYTILGEWVIYLSLAIVIYFLYRSR